MIKIGVPLKYAHLKDGRCILYLGERVRRTFQRAGAFIIPIVPVQDVDYMDTHYLEFSELEDYEKEHIDSYLDMVDGVIFPGGYKITPYDQYLLKRCVERNIPTLGICLGMQLMGSYPNDFKMEKNNTDIDHFQEDDNLLTHKVSIKKGTLLYKILEEDEILVNSFHNYHIEDCFDNTINAYSEDGLIEGVERDDCKFYLGIQWHPEISYEFDLNSRKIIDAFLKVCENK